MKRTAALFVTAALLTAGCPSQSLEPSGSGSATPATSGGNSASSAAAPEAETSAESAAAPADSSQLTPIPIAGGKAELSPENTLIQFVGTHADADPDPKARTGIFKQFSGAAQVDQDARQLQSVSVEIQMTSVDTGIERLTNHLKHADFFDANEYPTAKFQSTSIAAGEGNGQVTITGELTMLESTKEISFPAKLELTDEGVTLSGELTIDRTEFGIGENQDGVKKKVSLTVAIGKKSELPSTGGQSAGGSAAEGGGAGRRGGGGRGGPGGNFDPVARFKESDADGDGKLAGEEISERMRENLEATDTDGDGAVSLEEFQARIQQFRARGGRGGRGGGGGRGGPGGGERPQGRPDGSGRPESRPNPEPE